MLACVEQHAFGAGNGLKPGAVVSLLRQRKKAAGLQGWFKKTSQEMRPPDMYIQIYVIICIYIYIYTYIYMYMYIQI